MSDSTWIRAKFPNIPSRTTADPGIYWEAVRLRYELGSTQKEIASRLGVSQKTVSEWAKSDWWADMRDFLLEQEDERLQARFRRVRNKALARTEQALREGNTVLTRSGRAVKVPVGAKDAAVIAGVMTDKERAARGKHLGGNTVDLTALAQAFKKAVEAPAAVDLSPVVKEDGGVVYEVVPDRTTQGA